MKLNRREFLSEVIRVAATTGLASMVFYRCVTTPTGKSAFILISEDEEARMGDEAFRQILSENKLSKNSRVANMLKNVGRSVADASQRPNYKWQFELIASDQVNAFAVPGGKVAFYEGILPFCRNEAGLACVMGHEVGHAVARHGAQRMSQTLAVQGALTAADLSVARNSKNRGAIMGALGMGATVGVLLPYSREHEYEADALGLEYMARAGYDPDEAVAFWERFAQLTKGGGGTPEFLSTHPMSENRIREMKKHLKKARSLYARSAQKGAGETI